MNDYEKTPLWNNQLSVEERLDYLISELTIEEKLVSLTTGCADVPRLGIRTFRLGGEAAHGIEARHDQEHNRGTPENTTSFPQPIGMSGSFDVDLIRECGRIVGEEARALYGENYPRGLSRWAPTIDMERDPRWGRTEEGYGEDPYLAGEMAVGYIKGMRGDHPQYIMCAATLKHFYANNTEKKRASISASIDGRNKHEYYLEPFRKAVVEGGAEALMTAYNEINGIPAILNDEVQKICKDEWGLVHAVADGGDFSQTVTEHHFFETHAESCAAALKAGVDSFPDKPDLIIAAGREALERGLMTEEDLNTSLRNTFRTRIRLGLYDKDGDCPYGKIGREYLNTAASQEIGLQMAKAAMVLLKNEDNLLPVKAKRGEEMMPLQIAVIGPLADVWQKDWYGGIPPYHVTPLAGIRAEYPDADISYCDGLSEVKIISGGRYIGLDAEARLKMTSADEAETFIVNDWGSKSLTLKAKSNGLYVTLNDETGVISATKEEVFDWFVREVWKIEDIVETSTARKMSRSSGMVNCHVKSWNEKPVIIDENGYLVVAGDDFDLANQVIFAKITVHDGILEAVNMVFGADYAFVFAGTNPVINSKETLDRDTLELPPYQQLLTERVRSVNPNTVLTIISNYPHSLGKLAESVAAIIFTASGSQDLGTAIAQTISGQANPAGRLSMTWHSDVSHLPDINEYDIIKGKRTYQYFERDVLYPFGHGLSYSRFTYNNFTAVLDQEAGKVRVSLTVRNSGYYLADEVVQIYARKENPRVKRPIRQLKAFTRIKDMKPGERREVELEIALDNLRYYDVISEQMVLENGEYTFSAGASAKDIRGQCTIAIPGAKVPVRDPYLYTKALNYDDYRNVYLHRGNQNPDGSYVTCVSPNVSFDSTSRYSSCKLIFNDYLFTKTPIKICLDVKPDDVCKLVVFVNMAMVASEDFMAEDEYSTKEILINAEKVVTGRKVSVHIQIYGQMKITGFIFA
ncbi:MAG: glycoside hydrolase family 3 C-terminal domain-containing protein [Lachnospiraceae bacterium]|jgi:beta-glucosidase|nr:glycoside hydrolase family 3 C-terminal domain-containing protein [Lachnospiraceae bacterium]